MMLGVAGACPGRVMRQSPWSSAARGRAASSVGTTATGPRTALCEQTARSLLLLLRQACPRQLRRLWRVEPIEAELTSRSMLQITCCRSGDMSRMISFCAIQLAKPAQASLPFVHVKCLLGQAGYSARTALLIITRSSLSPSVACRMLKCSQSGLRQIQACCNWFRQPRQHCSHLQMPLT